MNLNEAFLSLHAYYGSHSAVARSVGLSIVHYRALRRMHKQMGSDGVPRRTEEFLIFKAQQCETTSKYNEGPTS